MKLKYVAVALTTTLTLAYSVQAQIALDDAHNYTMWGSTAGSATQTNGGTGFSQWTFSNSTGGNGSENGSYLAGGTFVDTFGKAFGLYANSGQQANAYISLLDGGLGVDQTLSLQMQNGAVDAENTVGFSLRNSSGQNVFEFYFTGGGADYQINVPSDASTSHQHDSGVAYTTSALTLDFTLGAANSWSFSIDNGVTKTTLYSSADGSLWSAIDQVRLFNSNAGNNNNVYFNTIQVVPEPSTLAIAGLAGLAALLVIRRRRA